MFSSKVHPKEISSPTPLLNSPFSYDSRYCDKFSGEQYLEEYHLSLLTYTRNFLDNRQQMAIKVYQDPAHCSTMHFALDRGQLNDLGIIVKNKIQENPYDPSDAHYMLYNQIVSIIPNYTDIIRDLDSIFPEMPLTDKPLITYRCYQYYVNKERLDTLFSNHPGNNKRYISSSLSYNLADYWCEKTDINHADAKKFIICIYIPTGSQVIPIVALKYSNYTENEILLPRTGVLKDSGLTNPRHKDAPIYVYVPTYDSPIITYIEEIKRHFGVSRSQVRGKRRVSVKKGGKSKRQKLKIRRTHKIIF